MDTPTKKEWICVCTKCNTSRSLLDAGGLRIGAASICKFTLGWCTRCKWFSVIQIRRDS